MKTKRVLPLSLAAWMSRSMAAYAIGEGAAPSVPVIGDGVQIGNGAYSPVPCHLSTRNLRAYAYDSARGKLLLMSNTKPVYSINKGQLKFKSDYKGQFVITDHALTMR